MNFFGIGGAEIVIIITIMLIVAGPKRMIQWAYVLGVWAGKARTMWQQAVGVLQQEIDEAGMDIKLPTEPPTRQSISRMVSDAVRPYTQELESTWKETQALSKGEVSKPTYKPQTMSLPRRTPSAAPAKPVAPPARPPAEAPTALGSWNGNPVKQSSDLGSWSAPKEEA